MLNTLNTLLILKTILYNKYVIEAILFTKLVVLNLTIFDMYFY